MEKLLKDKKAIIFFVTPALLLFTVVLFIPICQSVYYSFCEYKGLAAPKFIGFENYKELLSDKTMRFALKNSIFFLIFSFALSMASNTAPDVEPQLIIPIVASLSP